MNDNCFVHSVNLIFLVVVYLHVSVDTVGVAGPSFHHVILMGHFIEVIGDEAYIYTGQAHKEGGMDHSIHFVPVFVLIEVEESNVDKHVSELKARDYNYHTPNSKITVLDFTLIQPGHTLECAVRISDWCCTVS